MTDDGSIKGATWIAHLPVPTCPDHPLQAAYRQSRADYRLMYDLPGPKGGENNNLTQCGDVLPFEP